MPLPTPNNRESRGDFVSRCIQTLSDKGEMKDNQQRIAVCYTQWKEAKASADAVVGSNEQEVLISSMPLRDVTQEYVKEAKEIVRQLLDAATKVAACLEDKSSSNEAIEAWVFEKIVLSKSMMSSVSSYLEFREDDKLNGKPENTENTGLIEPAKLASEDEIRQKVYNNKFGGDTY